MSITTRQLLDYKLKGKKIVAVTAWDFAIAQILDRANVDLILVGDSLAMVALGYDTTIPLTLEEIIHHAKAVRRGVKKALLVVDLPFLTYQISPEQALMNAGKILQETGAQAVKLEGVNQRMIETIDRLVQSGIPVMGHVGLTPQSVHRLGYRQQGQTEPEQERIINEAIALEKVGVFAIVLEHIPLQLGARITDKLTIPTIGIGAGVECDGQVLVTTDLLGMSDYLPPFAKAYTNLQDIIINAVNCYGDEVRQESFPHEKP